MIVPLLAFESENNPTSIDVPSFSDLVPQLQKISELIIIMTITVMQPTLYILNLKQTTLGNSDPKVVPVLAV